MDRVTPLVVFHITAAFASLLLGAAMLLRAKGTPSHRFMGRIWVATMAATALSSFWIVSAGHWSWIHLLSVWTLFGLFMALRHIKRGEVARHRGWMTGLYIGLCVAGLFTLLPSRLLGSLVFRS